MNLRPSCFEVMYVPFDTGIYKYTVMHIVYSRIMYIHMKYIHFCLLMQTNIVGKTDANVGMQHLFCNSGW